MLTPDQIQNILNIMDKQHLMFIGKTIGPEYLTLQELNSLKKWGINPQTYYNEAKDIFKLSFHFGLIADSIGELEMKNATYEDIVDYFKKGKYIPLTKVQKFTLESVKKQYLGDIKANKGRIFNDINGVISKNEKNNRAAYEDAIRKKIEQGIFERKTKRQIASELGHLTGDWNRNFVRIVDFVSHTAFDEGRALGFENKYGEDTLVWKQVFNGACKHCLKLYTTNGFGSKPKIFKLSELKANGTNIGRKVAEWLPVIGSTHPYCRCTLHNYTGMFEWDEKKKDFAKPNPNYKPKIQIDRPKINFTFRGKEYKA